MDYTQLFEYLHPRFFEQEHIRSMPAEWVLTELALDLRADTPSAALLKYPSGITFGEYSGDLAALREAVGRVEEGWVQYFCSGERFFCAFDGDRIVSFCILSDMGSFGGLRIGGPGCVGTIPEYRRRGIGLETVRRATELLRRGGFDLSYIHYTHIADWYMKLGYQPVLRWGCRGILQGGDRTSPLKNE